MKVICPKCKTMLVLEGDQASHQLVCRYCQSKLFFNVYPAITVEAEQGKEAEKVVLDEDASCFFHEDKLAVVTCDQCGAYLCNLCDIPVEGNHYCSTCFKKAKEGFASMKNRTILYDDLCLFVALISFVMWPVTLITAPAVFIASIVFWKKVETPYPRWRWRFVMAMFVSLLTMIGWGALFVGLMIA